MTAAPTIQDILRPFPDLQVESFGRGLFAHAQECEPEWIGIYQDLGSELMNEVLRRKRVLDELRRGLDDEGGTGGFAE